MNLAETVDPEHPERKGDRYIIGGTEFASTYRILTA